MTFNQLLLLILAIWVAKWLFHELSGAWGRWRDGQPILQSAYVAKLKAEEHDRRVKRKKEIYDEYELSPARLVHEPLFYREFKEHWDWKSIRAEVVSAWQQESGSCPSCGVKVGGRQNFHVDHILPRSKYPHLRYLKSNLQVLCSRCNLRKGSYDGDDWEDVIEQREQEKKRKIRKKYYKKRKSKFAEES